MTIAKTAPTRRRRLLTKYPNLKVIVAPTTVGILAAAQVVKQAGKSDSIKVTGLGFPNDMKPFVADGTSPVFGLWSVPDLGYLSYQVAAKLVSGEITGKEGETFTVKGLNDDKPYTIGKDSVVILGPAFRFDSTNVERVQLLARASPSARTSPGSDASGARRFEGGAMERVGFTMRLLPGQEAEYRRRHAAVWPEMLDALRAAGARDYSIFLRGDDLFAYLVVDDFAAFRAYAGGERGQRPLAGRDGRSHRPADRPGDRLPPPARRGLPPRLTYGGQLGMRLIGGWAARPPHRNSRGLTPKAFENCRENAAGSGQPTARPIDATESSVPASRMPARFARSRARYAIGETPIQRLNSCARWNEPT